MIYKKTWNYKKIIKNNGGWKAEIQDDERVLLDYVKENEADIILLGSILDEKFENEIKKMVKI